MLLRTENRDRLGQLGSCILAYCRAFLCAYYFICYNQKHMCAALARVGRCVLLCCGAGWL
jgi:hypothetical protein